MSTERLAKDAGDILQSQPPGERFVAALDVGTTTLRCHVFDSRADIRGTAVDEIQLLYPERGMVEIDPEQLWKSVVKVINKAIADAGLTAEQITCLGMSTQRSSFTTWHKDTGATFHNIVTWRDLRANKLVQDVNKSLRMKAMRLGSKAIYCFTRNSRFLAGSQMKLMNTQVTGRLLWVMENVPNLKAAIEEGTAMFGTVDTWILYKLTGGRVHATDVSNAACTGFFDPFTMTWASWGHYILSIPPAILPQVRDTASDFGCTAKDIFGAQIPIRSCVADQSAAMFGSCAFEQGDIKVTLGTGSFLDVNTGSQPHASISGIYPIVGWRINGQTTYIAEGASNDTGTVITWAQGIGLIEHPAESSDMAESVPSSEGLCFVPSFSGLQAPINDGLAATGFIGVKQTTTKNHMVRALLESIAFRLEHLFQVVQEEISHPYSKIRVDGGVSQNNFLMQLLSDLTDCQVERPVSAEMSSLGAAYLAGLAAGIWTSTNDLIRLRRVDRLFQPRQNARAEYEDHKKLWRKAVSRFLLWYPEQDH